VGLRRVGPAQESSTTPWRASPRARRHSCCFPARRRASAMRRRGRGPLSAGWL
jgi:hypothetical protein